MTEAFPLHWPDGWPRTPAPKRQSARFDTPWSRAVTGIYEEIRLLGGRYAVVSSDLELRRDGLPYANQRKPDDPGVAVYFEWKGKSRCLACDRWNRIQDNIQAIRKSIEAIRGLERWGTSEIIDRAFAAFTALPAPGAERQWWDVLGIDRQASQPDIERAWRRKAREHHPDHGGSDAQMAEINAARDAAVRSTDG